MNLKKPGSSRDDYFCRNALDKGVTADVHWEVRCNLHERIIGQELKEGIDEKVQNRLHVVG